MMKTKLFYCSLLLSLLWSHLFYAQVQLGADIDGEATGDRSGHSVSLDGNRLAIGAPENDGTGNVAGQVRVYEWSGSAWNQLGTDIDGEAIGDYSGHSVSLDGHRLAIGAYLNDGNGINAGHVRVYEWSGTAWGQLGADIDGGAAGDQSGWSVSLDGHRLAIGAYKNDDSGTDAGQVRVYEWSGSAWTQLGAAIDGEAAGDNSGYSVSLDGHRLAIGAHLNDGTGSDAGQVRVYEWSGSAWTQLGADIDGEATGDNSGYSVSLDGHRLAIGAYKNDGSGTDAGQVRVYEWSGSAWGQLGGDIDGEAAGDQSGYSVSLDANRLAIGARLNAGNGGSAGHVRVYKWTGSAWLQLQADIDGEATGDYSGQSVSLDGNRLAIGAYFNDGNGINAGHVRVYELCLDKTGTDVQTACDSYTWIDGVTYTSSTNTPTYTFTDANGCDSVATLNLTIEPSATGTDVQTACDSYTWIDGVTYTSSTNTPTYTIVGGAANGCDSVATLNLILLQSAAVTDSITVCDSYTWIDGLTYTSSTNAPTYTIVGGSTNGCDSIVTLNLTIVSLDTTLVLASDTLRSSQVDTSTTYQWIDCANNAYAPIIGATNVSFAPSSSGSYGLILRQNGCIDTATCTHVILSQLEHSPEILEKIAIYPNPNQGKVALDLGKARKTSVRLSNALGQVLWTKELQDVSLAHLEIEGASGLYFLEVKIATERAIFKIIKK